MLILVELLQQLISLMKRKHVLFFIQGFLMAFYIYFSNKKTFILHVEKCHQSVQAEMMIKREKQMILFKNLKVPAKKMCLHIMLQVQENLLKDLKVAHSLLNIRRTVLFTK